MESRPVNAVLKDLLTGILCAAGFAGMALGAATGSKRYFVAGGLLLLLGLVVNAFKSGRKEPDHRWAGGSEGWEEAVHQRKWHRYRRRSHRH